MEQKKIVFIVTSLGEGGAQKVMSMIANECVTAGFQVDVISIMKSEVHVDLCSEISIDDLGVKRVGGLNNITIMLKQPLLRRKLKNSAPNIIVLFGTLSATFCYKSARRTTEHIIACERDNPLGMKNYMFRMAQRVYSNVQVAVFQMPQIADIYGIKENKYTVIPNACLVSDFDGVQFDSDSCSQSKLIISAGRLERVKRYDVLIDAFEIVHKDYPDYRLNIYGDGSERDALQEKIDNAGLCEFINLKGRVDNVWRDTETPYAFVLSSESEGIPNVIMEAMYYGIPCVSTDCEPGGARFLLDDGRCGLISNKNDCQDLATKLITLIEDSELHNDLVEVGKNRISSFQREQIIEMWLKTIRNTIIEVQ